MANHASHAALPFPVKGARFTVQIPYLDADGDPTDPTTPDTEVSKDGGAFAACTEEVTTITGSNGVGYITLSGAETDCSMLAIAAKVASGPKNTLLTIQPRLLADVENNTAQTGGLGSITLASGAAAFDLTGCFVKTTGGTGGGGTGGADNQVRRIKSYNTSTKVADVEPDWETAPDVTTTYDILLPEGMTLGALKALNPATAGRTLGVESDGHGHADVKEWVGNAVTGDPSGRPDVNIEAVRDSFDAATALSNYSKTVTVGAVNDTGASNNTFITDLTEVTEAHYNGALVAFVTGDLKGQVRLITGYNGTTKAITVVPNFTDIPANTETFVIYGYSKVDVRFWLGNAVTVDPVLSKPDVNVNSWGDSTVTVTNLKTLYNDSTAAANQKAFFDGTGYVGGSAKLRTNPVQLDGDGTAIHNLRDWALGMVVGAVSDASPSDSIFNTDLPASDNGYYNGAFLSFVDGPAAAAADDALPLTPVPGGHFLMGDAEGEPDEAPRPVTVAAFSLMVTEVTNARFAAFVAQTGYVTDAERAGSGFVWTDRWRRVKGAHWRDPQGAGTGIDGLDDHPVVQVSARDAEAFCRHHGLRLPKEAEWEFAARGADGRRFPWGNNAPEQAGTVRYANFGTVRCCAADASDGHAETSPVGSYPAGAAPFGHLDMAGNVWEWTASPFPGDPGERAIRGGGWGNNPYCLRTSYRHGNPPHFALNMVGFRCAGPAAEAR